MIGEGGGRDKSGRCHIYLQLYYYLSVSGVFGFDILRTCAVTHGAHMVAIYLLDQATGTMTGMSH